MLKRRAIQIMLLALAITMIASPFTVAQGVRKTAITGYQNFVLGTPQPDVLAANPELRPVSKCCIVTTLDFAAYGKPISTTTRRGVYPAVLVTLFWGEKLSVIVVAWDPASFQTRIEWIAVANAIRDEIEATYALPPVNFFDKDFRLVGFRMKDAAGNQLVMWHDDQAYRLTVLYWWGPFADAVDKAPKPAGGF